MICHHCNRDLPDGSKFCQYCGAPLCLSESEVTQQVPCKKRKARWPTILLSLVVFLVAILGTYYGSYLDSKSCALQGDFVKAEKYLFAPDITKLHDPLLSTYISAGLKYQSGDYQYAQNEFSRLAESEYLAASEMKHESEYQFACSLLDQKRYADAKEAFAALSEISYKDSSEREKEAIFYEAYDILKEKPYYISCYKTIDSLAQEGFSIAENELDNARELLYQHGIEEYRKGSLSSAQTQFSEIKTYKRTEDYLTLINKPNYKSIVKLINFENANEILLTDFYTEFLSGMWKSAEGRFYFNMDSNSLVSYNLPHTYASGNYRIYEGLYYVYESDIDGLTKTLIDLGMKPDFDNPAITKQFQFTIQDEDTVDVFCFSDGKTYRLYRQQGQ